MGLLIDLWGATPGDKCILTSKDGHVKPHFVRTLGEAETLLAGLSERAGLEIYFTPGVFKSQRRTATNLLGMGAFFLDVDCGEGKPYKNWQEGLLALLRWVQASSFWKPNYLVRSGAGLHVYWLLDRPYAHELWTPVATHFKRGVAAAGLRVDAAVTADAARVLRVPGTYNHKRGAPVRETQLTDRRLTLSQFASRLPALGPVPLPSGAHSAREWGTTSEYPPGDALCIAAGCQQMRGVQALRGVVAEPLWRAALSVLHRCTDAEQHVVTWSDGDPRFDRKEALAKAALTLGPATCAHFDAVNPGGCDGCAYAGRITSPILISGAGSTPQGLASEPGRGVSAFVVTATGVYFKPPSGEEAVRVTHTPVWAEEVRERFREGTAPADSSIVLAWRGFDGRERHGVLPQRDLHDKHAFVAWLADHNLISAIDEVGLMTVYINQYTAELLRKQGSRVYYDVLGWHAEGFLTGTQLITAAGPQTALVQAGNPIAGLATRGSLDAWKEGLALFAAPEYWRHAFAVLAGFGSPLLHLCGAQSAVVSLVGPSGAGKTLAAHAALSIYGDYNMLSQGASATANAWEKQLSCNRHVPYLLDEVTQYSVKLLTIFLYMAANGQGKASLTRNRDTRPAGAWQLVPYITSNHPVMDFGQAEVEEAHRRRLLELNFDCAMDGTVGRVVDTAARENAGQAGVVYLQAVCKARAQVPAMFQAACEWVRTQFNMPDANRFAVWTLASALVGGGIAKQCGLIDYDVEAICRQVAGASMVHTAEIQDADERATEVVREWLNAHNRQICYWRDDSLPGEMTEDPVARLSASGTLWIHRSKLNALLREERLPRSQLDAWRKEVMQSEPMRVRLAPGVPSVWCYVCKAAAFGFTGPN